jgi:methylated-DNA-[protein]-cysteine S-methyltransferase
MLVSNRKPLVHLSPGHPSFNLMKFFTDTFSTPFGFFSIAADHEGAIVATAFGAVDDLRRRRQGDFVADPAPCRQARDQILAYCAGERREFSVRIAQSGSEFQISVWQLLRRIPYGETRTYGQLAAELNQPAAARAVGRANATNPICLIVPCHRVIGANGLLTGFAFGEAIKRRLLEHERDVAARSRAA